MVCLPDEMLEKVLATSGLLTDIQHVKRMRLVSRKCLQTVACFLLKICGHTDDRYLENRPGSEYQVPRMIRQDDGQLFHVCAQWVLLSCREMMNADAQWGASTISTRMKLYAFLLSTNPHRGSGDFRRSFIREALLDGNAAFLNTDGWRAFANKLCRVSTLVCEDRKISPPAMQETVKRALNSNRTPLL